MTTRMLIDARHREETRVAVVKGNSIEEFDFESADRKQLKGNIYLAKVTRVEPSLQAAFIDYGGNRHGFLAFSEIHPDYYQIPREDREALLREEAEHAAEEAALRAEQDDDDADEFDDEDESVDRDDAVHDDDADDDADGDEEGDDKPAPPRKAGVNDDQVEALRARRQSLRRRYKIQDVIRRRQVLLVQVVKEERGNKGAALTTYLSLAGRYCVLMPNTSNGGGISRKISSAADRKRLKTIMADMKLPSSMGCIVRTAGLSRTRQEIKRDFDYLARLWDEIREKTLSSSAPSLVYGDSDLLKRAIRDIYNKDVDEVIVEGEDGYRQAKEFMRLLMPSHARRVKQYADAVPLFQRAHVEDQLAAMYNPMVQLKSGGYLVINPTEALVSIDINSGRSTREHNIEQTATATNLEAAQEIARQLRLRDMAGLVVIDFIDMDNNSNVRKVERAMKDALKDDRARIQVGRISQFGLMEMSRQRLRTGVLEASTRACPHCEGTGLVRTAASAGLSALRLIEDEAARGRGSLLTLRASQEAAIYVLNRKRSDIAEIEERYGVSVDILPDREEEGARMSVEAAGPPPVHAPRLDELIVEEDEDEVIDEADIDEEELDDDGGDDEGGEQRERQGRDSGRGDGGRKRRRRRGRRGRRDDVEHPTQSTNVDDGADVGDPSDAEGEATFAGEAPLEDRSGEGEGKRRRGRRGRRGGRRNGTDQNAQDQQETVSGEGDTPAASAEQAPEPLVEAGDSGAVTSALDIAVLDDDPTGSPKTRRRPRARKADPEAVSEQPAVEETEAPKPKRTRRKAAAPEAVPEAEAPAEDAKPKRTRRKKAEPEANLESVDIADPAQEATLAVGQDGTLPPDKAETLPPIASNDADAEMTEAEPPRRGWWQRTFGA